MSKKILFPLILFPVTFFYYFPIINYPLAPFDEGTILVEADRILKNQIPYKDFGTAYPPGQYYLLAGLFKAFGVSVMTERIYDLMVKSLLSFFFFLIVRKVSSTQLGLIAWIMSMVWIGYSGFPAYPIYPFFLLIYISFYCLIIHMEREKSSYVMLSAVFSVLAILFRHDLGIPAAVLTVAILIARRAKGVQKSWLPSLSYMITLMVIGLPLFFYFFLHFDINNINLLIRELFINPWAFLEYRWLPYPPLSRIALPFYLFPSVILAGLAASLVTLKRRNDNAAYIVLLLSLFGIVCFNQAIMRSDSIHLLPEALTATLLAPLLFSMYINKMSLRPRMTKAMYASFIIIFGITLYEPAKKTATNVERWKGYVIQTRNPHIERARHVMILPDIIKVVLFIKENTTQKDYIYVGVKNHDTFYFNDPVIYFLADRNYPVRYHELNPGVITTLNIQKEMVSELKNKPARLAVLADRRSGEPNPSSIDQKTDLLDNYLQNHFNLTTTYGRYEIWMKKNM